MTMAYRFARLGAGVFGALALGACGEAAQDAATTEKEAALELVYTVDKVTIERLAKTPPALTLTVEGTARSAGWTEISLEPEQIENGTLTYRLMGAPPEGMAAQVLTSVSASRLVDPLPEGVTQIRVTAADNELTEPVPPAPRE
ncbi:MAG: hypothetical protein ACLFWF_14955 [Alphaproteobacteria bacterium]